MTQDGQDPSYFECPKCGCNRFGTFVIDSVDDPIRGPRKIACHGCTFTVEQAVWDEEHPERQPTLTEQEMAAT